MVLLQGAASPAGPAWACVNLVRDGLVTLCLSEETLEEVRDVLTRPKTRSRFPNLTSRDVDAYLCEIVRLAEHIPDVPRVFQLPRDPHDEPYLNLALAVNATYLVSRDRDLLDLKNDLDFCQTYPGLQILDPASFLKVISHSQPDQQNGVNAGS